MKNLKVQDIENLGNKYLVSITDTKNDKPRQFIVGEMFYDKVNSYSSLRPNDEFTDRFFVQYNKGKCIRQVIGRNKFGEIPQLIAEYLKLPNSKLYTGHCFRRTSATLLANSGASVTLLRQLGGWTSSNIAEGYVENSMTNRQQIFERIIHEAAQVKPSTSKNSSNKIIIQNKNDKSAEADLDDFFENFEVTEQELNLIDQLNESKEPCSLTPQFTTANNNKILVPNHNQPKPAQHFTSKPPVRVSFQGPPNEPPKKILKISAGKASAVGQTLQSSSGQRVEINKDINSTFGKNSCVKYENCVFHGNITNNFYSS
ncbi:uncharacterized protein LOC122505688 [Leptopilina heterotoma]|uniref:uncharacterized protein LOC122505688 n=1 Tax=Leptopilina heterotoma TaxID=63436 RepID=UPI001CA98789|nr:uncharacterized protein LOC122505688 [Leptopilina heterotoma]